MRWKCCLRGLSGSGGNDEQDQDLAARKVRENEC